MRFRRPSGLLLPARGRRGGRGAAAVEFALTAPLLAALVFGAIDLGGMAYDRADMFGAGRSGVQYFMGGGADVATARAIVEKAWTTMPEGAVIAVTRTCACAGVAASCFAPCSGGAPPDVYARIETSAPIDGAFIGYHSVATDQIRLR